MEVFLWVNNGNAETRMMQRNVWNVVKRNAGKSAGKNAVRLPRLLVRRHARRSLAARRLLRLARAGKTTEAASG